MYNRRVEESSNKSPHNRILKKISMIITNSEKGKESRQIRKRWKNREWNNAITLTGNKQAWTYNEEILEPKRKYKWNF